MFLSTTPMLESGSHIYITYTLSTSFTINYSNVSSLVGFSSSQAYYIVTGNNQSTPWPVKFNNSFTWTKTFPVGGFAISGGEGNTKNTVIMTSGYNDSKTNLSNWYTNTNFIRLPIVWGYLSKGNSEYLLFTTTSSALPTSQSNWSYDSNYLTAIVDIVTDWVNKGKVVMIDYHTYNKWINIDLDNKAVQLSKIWQKTLELFNNYPIFKNLLVWFEIVNEPYGIQDLSSYNTVISAIRNAGYNNKIVLGLDAGTGQGEAHVINNNYGNYEEGFSNYSVNDNKLWPSDTQNNLCITLHQYFDFQGSGTNYPSNTICNPWVGVNGKTLNNGTTLDQIITKISALCKTHNCDIMIGEFGYDVNYNPSSAASKAITALLDSMNKCNTTNNFNSTTVSNILTQSKGGLWLGFAAWQFNSDNETHSPYYDENLISNSMFTNLYSKYFI